MHCPYCQNTEVRYSCVSSLHALRMLLNSPKRYCPRCQKKWRAQPRRVKNYKLYAMALPIVIVFTLGLLKLSDRGQIERQHAKYEKTDSSAGMPLLKNKKIMEKVKQYQKDPSAFEKLSGDQKQMAEKYMKKFKL